MEESNELREMVEELQICREERAALDKKSNALKEKENALKACILNTMSSMGVRSLTFDEIGRVGIRGVRHYEVMDPDLFMQFVFKQMLDNMEKGAPIMDGVAVQRRVSASAIDEYLDNNADDVDEDLRLRQLGLRVVEVPTLSVTKQ